MTQGAGGNAFRGQPLELRFWARVDRRAADECWPWLGSLGKRGYGSITDGGRSRHATHIALELAGSPRPTPAHGACHTCDNPACVNPLHLWWGTQSDNLIDASRKGRIGGQSTCQHGHSLSGDNVAIVSGRRRCRECSRIVSRQTSAAYRAKMRQQDTAMRKAAQRGDYCGIVEVDETDFRADEPVAKDSDTR